MMVGRLAKLRPELAVAALLLAGVTLAAQTPKPFPQPAPPPAQPAAPGSTQPLRPGTPPTAAPAAQGAPTETTLGVGVYPNAQFLASYDAGRGQRFYLYGAAAAFAEVVTFYRNALKQKGDVLFESPPTHQFETGRYRDETMAFPPSVTIKDYTWGGSLGYPNPKKGAGPERFPTVIQIVPVPPGTPQG